MIEMNNIDDYAAEYALGTLDQGERNEMAALRDSNPAASRAMTAWEGRLNVLCERIPNEMPSPDLFSKIERRIADLDGMPADPGAMRSTHRWQPLVLAFCLLLIVATGVQYMPRSVLWPSAPVVPSFVAVLQSNPSNPMFVVSIDPQAENFGVRRLMAAASADKDYELWIIPQGEKAPRPIGVVSNEDVHLPMANGITPALLVNATLAISVEPHGGSPTGLPTGPVIVSGKLVQASL